ncbi:LysM peptidoglycan-binding domain-containing protein [Herbaspirillum frisingense]|uniref:LysM peptidoglycan-binding domain-containing protein n=1 Tax=Herbaspirillum frisingense TaxID=92645 RepID=UPI0016008E3B|nr:LysM peptidoglycan-binding domain-containing protein [Herbaspirillum frisingense]QNB08849.1 LysM peptidoglycan-binding domain-containing protein [Herbaspirillum frisingense]
MVGIVAGDGLGLSLSSLKTLKGIFDPGVATQGRNGEQAYVNIATGNLILQDYDDGLAAHGGGIAAVRTYNSQGLMTDDNGDNWSNGIFLQQVALTGTLNAANSKIVRTDRDGAKVTFTYTAATQTYTTVTYDGTALDSLRYDSTSGRLIFTDGATGTREIYEAGGTGHLLSVVDTNGNTTTYTYSGNLLTKIVDASGDTLWYDYTGNNLTQIRTTYIDGGVSKTSTRVRYAYDTSNRLIRVTVDLSPDDNSVADGKVYQTNYTYDGTSKRIKTITQTDGTSLSFTYVQVGSVYKVASITDGLGSVTKYSYTTMAQGIISIVVVDPLGNSKEYITINNQLFDFYSPEDSDISGEATYGTLNWRVINWSLGDAFYEASYDANANTVYYRSEEAQITRTFDARNQVLTETLWKLSGSADEEKTAELSGTTRYVYDAANKNQLRYRISPEGRVTEYKYNSYGERVASIEYNGAAYDVSALADTDSPSEAVMLAWAATRDKTQTVRTDMTYDARGQLTKVTRWSSVDAQGNGLTDGSQQVTQYIYDQRGQLLKTIDGNGGVSQFTYDGLGRQLTAVNALGQATVSSYDDAGNKTTITSANGLVTTSSFDKAGHLVSVAQSGGGVSLGATKYSYDADGNLRMTVDPTGIRHWMIYDSKGRKLADIDAQGQLTEYVYTGLAYSLPGTEKATQIIHYATVIDTASLVDSNGNALNVSLDAVRPASSTSDIKNWLVYDHAGQLVKSVDGHGTVTENTYDAAGNLLSVTKYATTIDTSNLSSRPVPDDIVTTSSADDRITRNIYDKDELLVATLDGEGYLVEYKYDASGQRTSRIAYATASNPAQRASGSLAQLRPPTNAADSVTTYLYNHLGQLAGTVDAEGYLTENVYDHNGNVTLTVRYANKVVGTATASSTVSSLRPASSAMDRSSAVTYDALNRVLTKRSAENTVTSYTYDVAGNVIKTSTAVGTDDVRTITARYDLLGRLTGELTAQGTQALVGQTTASQIDYVWTTYGISYTYDAAGRLAMKVEQGRPVRYYYDADGRQTFQINALGEVQENQYNSLGQLNATVAYGTRIDVSALQGGLADSAFLQKIDAIRNPARDSKLSYTYDNGGSLSQSTDAIGNVTSYQYDAFGDVTGTRQTINGQLRQISTNVYDHRGQLVSVTADPLGINTVTNTRYDAFGRAIELRDANGNVSTRQYDHIGRLIQTKDPLNAALSSTYDAFDRVLSKTDALGNITRYAYDDAARSVMVTTPENIVMTTVHDRFGETTSVTDGLGNVTRYVYDADGDLIKTITPLGETDNTYDAAGHLILTTDPNGHQVSYAYDQAGRVLTRQVDPNGMNLVTSYAYDPKGQLFQTIDPNGVVTVTSFDLKGQKISQTVDPTGLNLKTQYSYDAQGHMLAVIAPNGTVTQYIYDNLGRRIEEHVDPSGLNLVRRYVYDGNGNVTTSIDANGNKTRYTYDADNRLQLTVDALGNVQSTDYDAAGRVIRTISYAVPVNLATLGDTPTTAQVRALLQLSVDKDAIVDRIYDKDGRLLASVREVNAQYGELSRYAYDANGNVVESIAYANRIALAGWDRITLPVPIVDAAHDAHTYAVYDQLNRAIYRVDAAGGLTAVTYDAVGNVLDQISYAKPIPAGATMSAAGLATAAAAVADASRDAHVRNTYDAANRLVWSVNGAGAVTQRVYDADGNVVRLIAYARSIAPNAAASSVVAGTGDRVSDAVWDAANRLVYQIDPLGNVSQVVYDKNGNALRHIAYATSIAAPSASVSTLASVGAALSPDAAHDRIAQAAYDAAGRMVFAVDASGAVTENTYDALGHVVQVRSYSHPLIPVSLPSGASVQDIRAAIVADASNDRIIAKVYDGIGQLTYAIDALGYVTRNDYDALGRIVRTVRYALAVPASTAATATALQAVLRPDATRDRTDTFGYDVAGRLIISTDPLGKSESYTYNGLGAKLSFTNKLGVTWTYDYDTAGRMISETTPQVAMTAVTQDASGNLVVSAAQSVTASVVTRMVYDALGNLLKRTEAAGRPEERTTAYEYDTLGHQVKTIYPSVGVYDAASDNLVTNGATGLATRTETTQTLYSQVSYNVFGEAVANRDVAGNMSYKAYDKLGRVSYDVDAMGYVTGYVRNAWGEATRLTRFAAATTLINGNPASLSAAAIAAAVNAVGIDHGSDRNLLTEYDGLGRAVKVTESQTFAYDSSAAAGQQYFIAGKTTRNIYDAFGDLVQVASLKNAVTDRWLYTTNYYDKSGHQTATIDALGYLTTQAFDAAGNMVQHTEYSKAILSWDGRNPTSALPQFFTSSDDRTTVYAYDQNNRKTSETRVSVEYSTTGNGTSTRADLVTSYGYDAVGNLTRTTDASGASTYSYYDALGRVTAVAAPTRSSTADGSTLTPLTVFRRDAYGNVVVRIDYANTSAANASTYSIPTASAQDRIALTQYDRFSHATQVTDAGGVNHYSSYDARGNLAKEWQVVTGNDGVAHTLFKAYQYDRLGQRTHVIDPASTTVLQGGLYVSVGASSTANTDESGHTTLTGTNSVSFSWSGLIDPTGGLVRIQTDYATVATFHYLRLDEYGNPVPDESGNYATDGVPSQAASRTDYFNASAVPGGAAVSWYDSGAVTGGISRLTYLRVWQQDASGNWIIKWQGSPAQANGSGITNVTQAQVGVIDTASEYNAFGEVVRKGVNGGRDEYFDYDNAGNLWRTNSGDGVDKVSLRDLQGNVTSTIQSAGSARGNINLRSYGTVDQIAALSDVRRTDTKYDALNHAVQQLQPQRLDAVSGVVVRPSYAQGSVLSSGYATFGEDGHIGGWAGYDSISVSWASLANLGSGDVRVEVDYATPGYTEHVGRVLVGYDEYNNPIYAKDEYGNEVSQTVHHDGYVTTRSQVVSSDQGASGLVMSWASNGGVSSVTGLRVYKRDINGNWQMVVNQAQFGSGGSTVEVAAPADPNTGLQLQIRPAGTAGDAGWTSVPLTNFGDSLRFDAASYAAGNYEYRVVATTAGSAPRITSTGTFSLGLQSLTTIAAGQTFGPAGAGVLAWLTPGGGTAQTLRVRPAGSNAAWQTIAVVARGNGYDGADFSALAAGDYEYELLWARAGQNMPYAHGTGKVHITAAIPPQLVPAVGTPVVGGVALAAGNAGSSALTAIRWPLPANLSSATFSYRIKGSGGAWSTLPVTTTGGGSGATQQVNIASLPPSDYEYELTITTSGTPPLAHATGYFSVFAQGPGHYETRSVPVQVPAQITPPDPSLFIIGWSGQPSAYGPPVVLGHDANGRVIFGQGYSATVTTDANGLLVYGPVVATPYQVYHTETRTETYTVQVVVGQTPVYSRDENGNIVRDEYGNPVITSYTPIYGTETRTRQVDVQVPITVTPDDPAKYLINAHASTPIYNSNVVAGYDPAGSPIFKKGYGLVNGVVKAIPYTETHPETHTEYYQVTVVTGYSPIYSYDEFGNVVRDENGSPVIVGYNPIYGTETRSRQVTVQVTTTITPPDPSNYIVTTSKPIYGSQVVSGYDQSGAPIFQQGYGLVNGVVKAIPYMGTQTQYQDQQFWVDGVIPAPTMTLTTAPYTPAYTIPGVATQYAATATAAPSGIVSQGGTPVTDVPTTTDGWLRPVVNQKTDRWGNVVEISDPRSAYWITTYSYNANNQLVKQVQPDANGNASAASPVTQLYYDQLGRQVAVRDANGNVNGNVYDAAGNLVKELHADGGTVSYAYNAFGDKVKMTDAMGNVISYAYDKLDHLLQTTRGVVAVYTVDGNNNLQWVATRAIVESATYDQAGRKLSQTNGNGETIRYVYDLRGNVIQTTQPLGQVTRAVFDMQGRKVAEVDPDNYSTTWSYDYFGQLLSHTDLGGAKYSYTYDNARQLQTQKNTRGQNLAYRYDAAGQVTRIDDNAIGQVTIYAYDLAGDRVQEKTIQGGVVYQDNHLAYDALKRLRWSGDNRVTVNYTYDGVGNRTHVTTHVINGDSSQDSDRWYGYDAMNRQTLVDGYNAAGAIGQAQGHLITYDKNGNRLSDTSWGNSVVTHQGYSTVAGYDEYGNPLRDEAGNIIYNVVPTTYSHSAGLVTEHYAYDALNRLTSTSKDGVILDYRYYDGADRLLQSGPAGTLSKDYLAALNGNGTGDGSETKISRFDANGRILHQRVLSGYGSAKYDIDYTSYDQAGNVLAYNVTNHEDSNHVSYYSYSLQRFEGYKPGTTYGNSQGQSGSTVNSYDVNGNLVAITDTTRSANNRSFVNDAAGHALYVNQGGNVERQVVVNGEVIGRYGVGVNGSRPTDSNGNPNFTGVNEFNFGYQTIDGDYPSASPGMVVVAPNDTLQSIARGAYGDSQLWYVIAEANGLANDSDLRVGQTLTVPNRANTIHNDANTFKPYDPSKVVGNTTPNIPAPPPPPADDGGCGVASIIVMIVVVVVAAITGGAAIGALGTALGNTGALIVGSAIGAAAGSIAGQLTGMALGIQDSFDWKGVATSAITAAITAGVGVGMPAEIGNIGASVEVNMAVRAAIGNAVTQGIGVVTGLQDKFSWIGVAAAGVGNYVGSQVGEALGLKSADFDATSASGRGRIALAGVAAGVASSVVRGGRVDIAQIAADAFGNALGSSIGGQIEQASQQEQQLTFAQDVANRRASSYWNPSNTVDNWDSSVMGGGDNPNSPTSSITLNAENTDNQSLINANNLATMPNYYGNSVAGQSYVAGRGDSISSILGTSSPQAIGNFMRANGMTNSTIGAGKNYFIPDSTDAYGDSSALGQSTLNADNVRIAQQQALAAQNQLASSAGNPYDSINLGAQVTRDNPYGLTDDQRASVMAYAKGGWVQNPDLAASFTPNMQSAAADAMGAFSQGPQLVARDPVLEAQAAAQNRRFQNDVGIAAGGPVLTGWASGARLLGAPETVVENFGEAQTGIMSSLGGIPSRGPIDVVVSGRVSVAPSSVGLNFSLGADTIDSIQAMPRGTRPDPSTYMPANAIDAQLAQFDNGASRFMSQRNLDKYGPAQADGTSFVMTNQQADQLLRSTGGNARAMEQALGLPDGFLNDNALVRVNIPNPRELNLRVPNGNEAGANDLWIPGGKLPTGNLEAVIDLGGVPASRYNVTPLKF